LLLVITGGDYVVSSVAAVAFSAYIDTVRKPALPLHFGEFIVVLWLAFMGAKPRTAQA
jgi:hypothetical protein